MSPPARRRSDGEHRLRQQQQDGYTLGHGEMAANERATWQGYAKFAIARAVGLKQARAGVSAHSRGARLSTYAGTDRPSGKSMHRERQRMSGIHFAGECPENWAGSSGDQRHICFSRFPIATDFGDAVWMEPLSRPARGHPHCSKRSMIVFGMNRVRAAYMCRSPSPRC
jgi:hypothetical protein